MLYTLWGRLFTGDFSVSPSPLDVARKDLRKLLQVNNGICFNAPIKKIYTIIIIMWLDMIY